MADRAYPAASGPHLLRERQQEAETEQDPAQPPEHTPSPRSQTAPDDTEKTIVVRDRRKPNQYTTDNIVAREWLPILRVGDAFFFYSVYLSMANRETESSWGSLRTQAEYLQCSVDLIVRGNKLLEICELVHIETGNQYTSNEYYILDPPPLTPELCSRIRGRLDQIARQESSQNWASWVKQVRRALDRHRTLTDIWAERRARRGGRPIKALRPAEALAVNAERDQENGACDTHPGFQSLPGKNGKGDRASQSPWLWATPGEGVSHNQGACESQPEQAVLTNKSQQDKGTEEIPPLLVREWLARLGVSESTIATLEERYSTRRILQQLEWLRYRNPRDPAAMLVRSIQDDWAPPVQAPALESTHDRSRPGKVGQADHQANGSPALEPPWSMEADRGPAVQDDLDDGNWLIEGVAVDARSAWAQLLAEIRMQMTRVTFDIWLGGAEVTAVHGNVVSVLVSNDYAAEWLDARWKQAIERTLSGIAGCPVVVRFWSPGGEMGPGR